LEMSGGHDYFRTYKIITMANLRANPSKHQIPANLLFYLGGTREILDAARLLVFVNRYMKGVFRIGNPEDIALVDKYFPSEDLDLHFNTLVGAEVFVVDKERELIFVPNLLEEFYDEDAQQEIIEKKAFCSVKMVPHDAVLEKKNWQIHTSGFIKGVLFLA